MTDATNGPPSTRPVLITAAGATLAGDLVIPTGATGIVIFAHGSGSSRFSSRNRRVAQHLQRGALATLLFDLLTADEEEIDARTAELRFDIPLLSERLAQVVEWVHAEPAIAALPIGCFGASTGAAAALVAAARRPQLVQAVVSRGGRPDLAGDLLASVRAPTLLIVGGFDTQVIEMNETALHRLASPAKELVIVPGATHLFEEPGTLDQVADLALDWFERHLAAAHAESASR